MINNDTGAFQISSESKSGNLNPEQTLKMILAGFKMLEDKKGISCYSCQLQN